MLSVCYVLNRNCWIKFNKKKKKITIFQQKLKLFCYCPNYLAPPILVTVCIGRSEFGSASLVIQKNWKRILFALIKTNTLQKGSLEQQKRNNRKKRLSFRNTVTKVMMIYLRSQHMFRKSMHHSSVYYMCRV